MHHASRVLPLLLLAAALLLAPVGAAAQSPESTGDAGSAEQHKAQAGATQRPSASAGPASAPTAVILEHGLFEAVLDEEGMQAADARLIENADSIPAAPGTLFGFRYRVEAPAPNEPRRIDIRLEHPPVVDPASGETFESYVMPRQVVPGREYVQLQRLPENAPAGEYRFSLLHDGKALATQAFTVQGADREFALLDGELQARCRSLTPRLGSGYGPATLLTGHTFALRLPPGPGVPSSGDVCFLALETKNAQGMALSDMQGELIAPIQPLEKGLQILAVSFSLLDDDQLPEIIVVARNIGFDPPLHDSRVYFAVQREKSPAWGRRPDLDTQVASMQSAHRIRSWLRQHPQAQEPPKPAADTAPASPQQPQPAKPEQHAGTPAPGEAKPSGEAPPPGADPKGPVKAPEATPAAAGQPEAQHTTDGQPAD